MHEEIGLNFAAALRSFLRQDPDIIMIGEIRDFETAEIGIKAALTGNMKSAVLFIVSLEFSNTVVTVVRDMP